MTADTITDEQIRELLESVSDAQLAGDALLRRWLRAALHDEPYAKDYPSSTERMRARARCAEILNARAKEQK